MTHPVEFRRHVLSIKKKEGLTFEQTAKRFAVGIASLTRWNKTLAPKATRENRPRKVDLKKLAKDVETYQGSESKLSGLTLQHFVEVFWVPACALSP